MIIPEHGEEYNQGLLKYSSRVFGHNRSVSSAIDFMLEGNESLYFILGPRGSGKTFAVRQSLLVRKAPFAHYGFKRNLVADLVPNPRVTIFDDFHYLCEACEAGVLEKSVAVQ